MEFTNIENLSLDDCQRLLNQDPTNKVIKERYTKLLASKKEEDINDFARCKTKEDIKNYEKKYSNSDYKGIYLHIAYMILHSISDEKKYRDKERRQVQRTEELQEANQWLKRLLRILSLFAFLLVVVIGCFFAYNRAFNNSDSSVSMIAQNDSLLFIVNEKDSIIRNLKKSIEYSEKRNADFKLQLKNIPLVITEINVINENNEGNAVGTINQSETTFLAPQVTYIGATNKTITMYFKLHRPDGTVSNSNGHEYNISSGKNKFSMLGWGNPNPGFWPAGNYRIEIMYCDKCIYEDTFVIYDDNAQ